jgi:hypothetical protein
MSHQLNCISCGSPIAAEDANLQNLVAKCRNCNAVFSFMPGSAAAETPLEFKDPYANISSNPYLERPENGRLEAPKGVIMERDFGELRFIIPWRNTRRWGFFLLFTVVWNTILFPFVAIAIGTGEWRILLFCSIHLIVGLSFLIYTLGLMLNKTRVVVTSQGIDINHAPIPIPFNPNRFMAVREVEQLFVEEYVPSRTNGRPDYTYAVTALTTAAERIRLVGGFSQPGHALFMEQEIENFLGIKNRPVL